MAQQVPQHRALMYSDFGVRLRRLNPSHVEDMPVTYAHQDDYYIIGLMEKGTGCGIIDFKEVTFSQGDVFLVQPGQVHVLLREELLKLHTIAEETRLLCQYKIDTAEQLFQVQGELEHEKERMVGGRRQLQYQCRSIRDPERMAQVKREIKELNGKIGENRRKIKLCQGIGERSCLMREKIRIIHQEKNREKSS